MKKFSALTSLLLVLVFFVAPSFTYAACTAYTACTTSSGAPGTCDDIGAGNCIPNTIAPSGTGAGSVNVNYIKGYSTGIISIINDVIVPVLFAVAFLMFVYSIYQYFILGAAEEESRAKGRQFLLWSIIGFAVIFSVWGLVNIVMSTFGLTPGGVAPHFPTL